MKMNDYDMRDVTELGQYWRYQSKGSPCRRDQTMEEMKKMSLEFFNIESKKQQKQVNYKQVETMDDDEKADVDQEAKYCSTRREQNDRKTCV